MNVKEGLCPHLVVAAVQDGLPDQHDKALELQSQEKHAEGQVGEPYLSRPVGAPSNPIMRQLRSLACFFPSRFEAPSFSLVLSLLSLWTG